MCIRDRPYTSDIMGCWICLLYTSKSGTAEYPCPTPDAPGRICTHAWFIAIGSVQDRRVAVAVMVEGGGEGSSVGASLAGEVLAAAFR